MPTNVIEIPEGFTLLNDNPELLARAKAPQVGDRFVGAGRDQGKRTETTVTKVRGHYVHFTRKTGDNAQGSAYQLGTWEDATEASVQRTHVYFKPAPAEADAQH